MDYPHLIPSIENDRRGQRIAGRSGELPLDRVTQVMRDFDIDPEKPNPATA